MTTTMLGGDEHDCGGNDDFDNAAADDDYDDGDVEDDGDGDGDSDCGGGDRGLIITSHFPLPTSQN